MKILLVFTGGTIGSTLSGGWIAPDEKKKYLLLEQYQENARTQPDFDIVSPYTALSENLSARELNLLVRCVSERLDKGYDGIIVTHGTDTLPYSAAALALALGSDCLPVVLVSSNYPLEDPRANGLENFAAAVALIESGSGRGVFVSYRNRGEAVLLYSALGLFTHGELSDELHSAGAPFAFYENGMFRKNSVYRAALEPPLGAFDWCANPGILVLSAVPGEDYGYEVSSKQAVILRPFHSGTLPTASGSFLRFCAAARENNIPVFVVNVPKEAPYESMQLYGELSLIPLPGSAFVSVYMKLWAAVSLGKDVRACISSL